MEEFYKKKVIRDFLTLFSESKWKNLCVLCIEYGILILKKNYQVSSLSMDDIEQFVDDLIQEDARKTKKNLKKFDIGHKLQSDVSITSNTNSRPSSNWRKGDTKTIFDGNDNDNENDNNKQQQQQLPHQHYNYSKQSGNTSYYADTDMSVISRRTKEKAMDDILYPKHKVATTYKNDYLFNSGNKKYNHKSDYTTTYSNNYNSNKLKRKEHTYHRNNSNRNDYSFSRQLSTSNSNSNMKFNSGLQMLKMRTPSKTSKHAYTRSSSTKRNVGGTVNNITNIYESKYKNISSKIKNQIETDKKIYEMMKNKKRDDRKTFEDRESSITYRKSEMSFEEGFSSLV